MKYLFVNLIFLFIGSMLSAQQKGGSVTANVTGWGNDTIFVLKYTWGSDREILDTLIAVNGRVSYQTAPGDTTGLIFVSAKDVIPRPNSKRFTIPEACVIETIVFPEIHEQITGKLYPRKLLFTSSGTGLDYHRDAAQEHSLLADLKWQEDSINRKIEFSRVDRLTSEQRNELFNQRGKILSQIRALKKEAFLKNPQAQLSGKNLSSLPYEEMITQAAHLTREVRYGLFKTRIDASLATAREYLAHLEAKKIIKEGNPAPAFELKDSAGTLRTLSEFKGKWVVLDFWGSWCGWCLKGFPDMKTAYQKHKGQMEIIGIACNDAYQEWQAAIIKYELPWIQLLDDTREKVSTRYAVSGYPTKIIIDPQGIIRGIIEGEDPKFYPLLDELLLSDK